MTLARILTSAPSVRSTADPVVPHHIASIRGNSGYMEAVVQATFQASPEIIRSEMFTTYAEGTGFVFLEDVANLDYSEIFESRITPSARQPNWFLMRGYRFLVGAATYTTAEGIPELKLCFWMSASKVPLSNDKAADPPYDSPEFSGDLFWGLPHPLNVWRCRTPEGKPYLLLDVGDHE